MERRRSTMEYDVMIHNAELLIDAFDADHDVIYATGLTSTEAETVADILMRHGVSVCLLPIRG